MTLSPEDLIATDIPPTIAAHTARDSSLYALGLGLGMDPTDRFALRYLAGENQLVIPTMAFVLSWLNRWIPRYLPQLDFKGIVDAERSVTFHAPIPLEGKTVARLRVTEVLDKGADKGALIRTERELRLTDGTLLATTGQSIMARRNGGFGGAAGAPSPPRARRPARSADFQIVALTSPQQALIYRLSGDDNPLHSDPDMAQTAGFQQPILHGLSTFGLTAFAAMRAIAPEHDRQLKQMSARFLSPVLPGERLLTEIWELDGSYFVETSVPARSVVVLAGEVRFG